MPEACTVERGIPAPAASKGPRARRAFQIAVLTYGLPRPGCKRGGIERVAHDLADGLARRGHHVIVYSHDPESPGAVYECRALPWRTFTESWAGRRVTMGYLGNVLALLPDIEHSDVVIAHGDSLLLPLRGKPVLRVMHGSALDEARTATSLGRRLLQLGVYGVELLSAAANPWTVGVSENTRRSNPLVRRTIPNGVNRARFRPSDAKTARPTLLFVGALTGRKRGRWLIEQFTTRVRPAFPDAQLHIVCDSDPRVPGVWAHTGVTDEKLIALYQRAWVYVSPSTYEGFGLPYLEALACGTAVVATPNAGSREVLEDGAFGRLVADDSFADSVIELLGDERARRTLEQAGLERAATLDLERTVDSYESLIDEMVAGRA
jgi:glycosyltransferase involved in cell wall biosynthesis